MTPEIHQQILQKHRNYNIIFHSEEKLRDVLATWSRVDMLDWLQWNDPNGTYLDEDTLREFDRVATREEAQDLIIKQITEDHPMFKSSIKKYYDQRLELRLNSNNKLLLVLPPF